MNTDSIHMHNDTPLPLMVNMGLQLPDVRLSLSIVDNEPKEFMRITRLADGTLKVIISGELYEAAREFWDVAEKIAGPNQRLEKTDAA